MKKSKAHFRITHNGLATAVPVSYFDFTTSDQETIRKALSLALHRKVSDTENPTLDKTQVIDAKGNPIKESFTVNDYFNNFNHP